MRLRGPAFALTPLVLQLAACAAVRAPAAAESVPPPLAGIAFAPVEAEPGELRWSGRANYHEVATFIEALPRRFPAGCSSHLSLSDPQEEGGRYLVRAEGRIARERGGRAPAACADFPAVVRAFDALSATIPKQAWTREAVMDGLRFEIAGFIGGGAAELEAFASALSASDGYCSARLLTAAPAEQPGPSVLAFRMELRLRTGACAE
ncbi:MAG TPA: hypothetical protein VLT61_10140 [Anaeromyxobacteraceae bacterium]|nr:hypothetical protein [Anaeromyxobacteraceae bacterium]